MQRLTTREPDLSMLECAIVSVNVVLHGLPAHAKKTPEGWAILHDYRESEKGYVPPVTEEAKAAEKAEDSDRTETPEKTEAADPVEAPDNAEVPEKTEDRDEAE